MKKVALRVVAHYLRNIRVRNLVFCSFAICVVITTHARLIQGHTAPLIKPEQQETSSSTTVREDDQP
jgi:hypothetical protein